MLFVVLQEEIIPFFQSVKLSKECTTTIDCYVELAEKVRAASVGVGVDVGVLGVQSRLCYVRFGGTRCACTCMFCLVWGC